jgi:DNA-binding MarR family transcriptional regulator
MALAGLIEGMPNHDDRRETQLRMTKKGRALYEKLVPVVLNYEQQLLSSLSEDEMQGLVLGLDKVERGLGLVQDPDECP